MVKELDKVLELAGIIASRYGYDDYGAIVLKYIDQPVAHILRQVKWRALNYYSRRKKIESLAEEPVVTDPGSLDFMDFLENKLDEYDRQIFELWLWDIDPCSEGYSAGHVESVLDRCFMRLRIAYREL